MRIAESARLLPSHLAGKIGLGATATYYNDDSVETVTYGNGTQTHHTYDDAGRPLIIRHETTGGVRLHELGYTWTPDGLVDLITETDDAEIRPTIFGGTGVRSADPYQLTEFPYRLEAGTQNLAGIAGLSAGLDWIEKRGMDNIYRHEMELLGLLQEGLAEMPGVKIRGTRDLKRRVATLSVTVDGYDPSDVGTILDVDYGVQTRTGLQCAPPIHEHMGTTPRGTIRFSPGPFTTRADIEATLRAMGEIAAERNALVSAKGG